MKTLIIKAAAVLLGITVAFQVNANGGGKTKIYISGFENKSSYQEEGNELKKIFTSITAKALEEKGLQPVVKALEEKGLKCKDDDKGCDYILNGEILFFFLDKNPEIIPFVNRWRKVTTASVKVRLKLTGVKDKQVVLDTRESTTMVHKGKEQVDFNVGKDTADNTEPNIETIFFDTGFKDTLMGQCTIKTLEKLTDKIVGTVSGAGRNEK